MIAPPGYVMVKHGDVPDPVAWVRVRIGTRNYPIQDCNTGIDPMSSTSGDYPITTKREKTMPITQVTKYRTSDGQEFDDAHDALHHERICNFKIDVEAMIREEHPSMDVLDWTAVEVASWIAKNFDRIAALTEKRKADEEVLP